MLVVLVSVVCCCLCECGCGGVGEYALSALSWAAIALCLVESFMSAAAVELALASAHRAATRAMPAAWLNLSLVTDRKQPATTNYHEAELFVLQTGWLDGRRVVRGEHARCCWPPPIHRATTRCRAGQTAVSPLSVVPKAEGAELLCKQN